MIFSFSRLRFKTGSLIFLLIFVAYLSVPESAFSGVLNPEYTNDPNSSSGDPTNPSNSSNSQCPTQTAPSADCQLRKNLNHTRVSKFASSRPSTSGTHYAIDLFMPFGEKMPLPQGCKIYPCLADGSRGSCYGQKAADGTYPLFVQNSGVNSGYGKFMLFDCSEIAGGNNVCVRYAHLEGYDSDSNMEIKPVPTTTMKSL